MMTARAMLHWRLSVLIVVFVVAVEDAVAEALVLVAVELDSEDVAVAVASLLFVLPFPSAPSVRMVPASAGSRGSGTGCRENNIVERIRKVEEL